jgi:hypothetical protein
MQETYAGELCRFASERSDARDVNQSRSLRMLTRGPNQRRPTKFFESEYPEYQSQAGAGSEAEEDSSNLDQSQKALKPVKAPKAKGAKKGKVSSLSLNSLPDPAKSIIIKYYDERAPVSGKHVHVSDALLLSLSQSGTDLTGREAATCIRELHHSRLAEGAILSSMLKYDWYYTDSPIGIGGQHSPVMQADPPEQPLAKKSKASASKINTLLGQVLSKPAPAPVDLPVVHQLGATVKNQQVHFYVYPHQDRVYVWGPLVALQTRAVFVASNQRSLTIKFTTPAAKPANIPRAFRQSISITLQGLVEDLTVEAPPGKRFLQQPPQIFEDVHPPDKDNKDDVGTHNWYFMANVEPDTTD